MNGAIVEISRIKLAGQRKLKLDKATRDALADYCKDRWPHHTAKMAAREWDLTVDEARNVVLGRTSFNTYDRIKKAGGWPVILAVEAAVVGHGLDQFLARIGASNANHDERFAALVGDPWLVPGRRRHDPPDVDHSQDDRGRSLDRRAG